MRVVSRTLATMSMPYAVKPARFGGRVYVLASPEDVGATRLFDTTTWREVRRIDTPGGCMDFLQIEPDGPVYAVMECFLGYRFSTGAIYELAPVRRGEAAGDWSVRRLADLPFGHRLGVLSPYTELIAATIAETKETPEDWTQPGEVRVYPVGRWDEPTTVVRGLHRNHGIATVRDGSSEELWVSAMEGMYALSRNASGTYASRLLTDRDISEMAVFDVDGDGKREIVTVEPFHGDTLRVYRVDDGTLEIVGERDVQFGHGLWVGTLLGRPRIVVGNRAGNGSLRIFTPEPDGEGRIGLSCFTVAENVRTANTVVFPDGESRATMIGADQETGTITKYEITGGEG